MKHSPFNNLKIYRYFFIAFILVLGILAIYVSCKSKSPTEPTSSLHNQISTQSTNNTTTSSSTTTSVKPGQSPTNTTTLITSRNLTTTSTSTSTTSSSTTSTTTTSRKPTTTSVGAPLLKWCFIDGLDFGTAPNIEFTVNNGDIIDECRRARGFIFYPRMKNVGTAPAENVTVTLQSWTKNTNHEIISVSNATSFLGTITADGTCVPVDDIDFIYILWCATPPVFPLLPGDEAVLTFVESFSNKTFTLTIRCPAE